MNNKFDELYKKIISQHIGQEISELSDFLIKVYPPQHQYFDRFKIINEIVKSKQLVPIPLNLINKIEQNIIKINSNAYKINYRDILKLIKQSEYLEADVFVNNFEKYTKDINGTLYIIFVQLDENDNIINNKTLNAILKIVDNDELGCIFFNQIIKHPKTIKGLNIIKRYEEIEKYKDALVFVNKNSLSEYFTFDDVLDHQLTHFIQRITNFEDNPKIINRDYAHNGLTEEQRKILDKFVYKHQNRILIWTMIVDKFSKEEYLETIKDIINFFKRFYILKGNNQNKEQWLDNLLTSINNYSYFYKHNLFDEFNIYLDSEQKNQTFNITFVLICICYFILKLNYDIDKVLKDQFKNL